LTHKPLRLGIDTGGTFTDASILDEAGHVRAAAKSPTTHDDLARGIALAVARVLEGRNAEIGLVGLSTTLATNALVEGRGGRVGLVLIGMDRTDLDRAGLGKALGSDPLIVLEGGHDAHGRPRRALDLEAAAAALAGVAGRVDAVAVTGRFAVRNPDHERALRDLVVERLGLPCTASHELTAGLDAPRRALTTVLNARLVPAIHRLLDAVHGLCRDEGIEAPVMVVRGDGSLMRAATARLRPVETILSGPAASVVGGAHLASDTPQGGDAVIVDVGGTTTDIALLEAGRPRIAREGAVVGGHRTMVEAIELRTYGLGGDSAVGRDDSGRLTLGPGRHYPLSLLARDHPGTVEDLAREAGRGRPRPHDGRFALALAPADAAASRSQRRVLELLAAGPQPLEAVIDRHHLAIPLTRLIERGRVLIAGFTPSDAAHVLGLQATWDAEAARLGALLEARKSAPSAAAEAFAREVMDLAGRTGRARLIEATAAAMGDDLTPILGRPGALVAHALGPADAGPTTPLLSLGFRLNRPVVALGGAAGLLMPDAAAGFAAEVVRPPHHDVANAVGAVVGEVRRTAEIVITAEAEDRYVLHGDLHGASGHGASGHGAAGPRVFADIETAVAAAVPLATEAALARARESGAADAEVSLRRLERKATLKDGAAVWVELRLVATASGRPRPAGAEPATPSVTA